MTIIDKKFSQNSYQVTYLASDEHHAMRLDKFIGLYLNCFSRQTIQAKITNKEIYIKGRIGSHKPSTTIHSGDIVSLTIHKTIHEDEYWHGKKIKLNLTPTIIYEDQFIVVISKPPYMATHPTGRHIFNCATVYLETHSNCKIKSIHRIDRETSGVLLFAKNSQIASVITNQFENAKPQKCYFFISKINTDTFNGKLTFTASQRLRALDDKGIKRVEILPFPQDSSEGKMAQTDFHLLHIENNHALGLAFPKTGRQHQIRVHAKVHGLPLVGDKIYLRGFEVFQRFKDKLATKEDHELLQIPRHALHALALKIEYQNKPKTFRSPLPNDLIEWIDKFMSISLDKLGTMIDQSLTKYQF
ncbi:MAG: RluA family pseudouridine synthase [Bacteriovoracaceae bacterium]|nr:RluA family pseudouridine synthase [Bacteriovoracaceae bacterium]